jgi:hypothetical protein
MSLDNLKNQVAAAIRHPVYGWGVVVICAIAVVAWTWCFGTFMQWFTDTAIVTTTVVN